MQSRIIIILIPFLLLGCEKKKKYIEGYEIVKKDTLLESLRKIPEDKLAKIDTPLLIDLDTVVSKHQTIKFEIKNISKNILRIISIKPIIKRSNHFHHNFYMQIFILRIKVILHIRLISMVHSILLKEKLILKATRNRLEAASL